VEVTRREGIEMRYACMRLRVCVSGGMEVGEVMR